MTKAELYKNWKATIVEIHTRNHTDQKMLQLAIDSIKTLPEFVKTCRDNNDFYERAKALPWII